MAIRNTISHGRGKAVSSDSFTDPAQRVRRNVILGGCLFILLGVLALGLMVCMLLWPAGPSLGEVRAKYGDIQAKAQAIVDARKAAQDKALQEARAKVPPDAATMGDGEPYEPPPSPWPPHEERVLWRLGRIELGPDWSYPDQWEEDWRDLEEDVAYAKAEDSLSPFEVRFDPNTLGREGALDAFREFMASEPYLSQSEAYLELGVYGPETGDHAKEWKGDPLWHLNGPAEFLACKASVLAKRGKREEALRIAWLLFGLAFSPVGEYWHPASYHTDRCEFAERALQSILAQGPIPQAWRTRFIDEAGRFADNEKLREQLRVSAATSPLMPLVPEQGLSSVLGLDREATRYRAYDVAEGLCGLLDRPSSEWPDHLQAIRTRFDLDAYEDMDMPALVPLLVRGECAFSLPGTLDVLLLLFQKGTQASIRPDMLDVAFALEDARAETGQYPATLDALVPAKIEAIPIDPISQTPIVYEQNGRGYALKLRKIRRDNNDMEVVWSVQPSNRKPALE